MLTTYCSYSRSLAVSEPESLAGYHERRRTNGSSSGGWVSIELELSSNGSSVRGSPGRQLAKKASLTPRRRSCGAMASCIIARPASFASSLRLARVRAARGRSCTAALYAASAAAAPSAWSASCFACVFVRVSQPRKWSTHSYTRAWPWLQCDRGLSRMAQSTIVPNSLSRLAIQGIKTEVT